MNIVMYHYVRPISGSSYPSLKGLELDGFKRQLDFFSREYTFVNEEEVIELSKSNKPFPKKSIWLTFDDGYKDHVEYVLPELKKRKLRGSFFPPARPLKEQTILDVNSIHFIIEKVSNTKELMTLLRNKLAENGFDSLMVKKLWEQVDKTSRYDPEEVIFFKRCLQQELPKNIRKKVIESLFEEVLDKSIIEFSRELYMSPQDIAHMSSEGMFIGCHGYQHSWLNRMNYEKQKIDLSKSLGYLKEIGINQREFVICYPYGGYNKDTLKLAAELGFSLGLTTKTGTAEQKHLRSKYEIPRMDTNDFPQ